MILKAKSIIKPLLAWYGRHKRDLPWRQNVTPYRVWLSEIMLQQTTVPAVVPYFLKFTEKYPNVQALAAAPVEDILRDWAGLGYYSRARNLHACAKGIEGDFPSDLRALKALPGIGDYTAAAIRAIAFNERASVVDGNVDRVISRLFAIKTPLPQSKPQIRALAESVYMDAANTAPAALPQAFMDLGATICTPKSPKCGICPLFKLCPTRSDALPEKAPKKAKPKRIGWVYWVEKNGKTLLHRRPDKGLLGGMAGLPTSEWADGTSLPAHLNGLTKIADTGQAIRHVFTHFELTLHVATANIKALQAPYYWGDAHKAGLPTVFKKAVKLLEAAR